MKDLIHLPEEYVVHKTLTLEHFLKGAQLTEKNKRDIEKTVLSITLVYDVHFTDRSEIILIDIRIERRQSYETDYTIAGIIAQAIPYHCIQYIHDNEYGRLVVFQTRPNTANSSRRIITKQASTQVFNIRDIPYSIHILLSAVEIELKDKNVNAEESIRNCLSLIDYMRHRYKDEWRIRLIKEQQSILTQLEYGAEHADAVIEKILYNDCVDTDNASDNWDYQDDHNITQQLSIESLCTCAYAIYSEFAGPLEDYEWLLQYAICCNETMLELYEISVTDSFYQKLGALFSEKELVYSDDECIYIVKEKMQDVFETI